MADVETREVPRKSRGFLRAIRLGFGLALCAVSGAPAASAACLSQPAAKPYVIDPKSVPRLGSFHFGPAEVDRNEVILTFDDGPRPDTTPKILDALAKACVKATFFIVGRMADKSPDLVRRIAREGHTVATHSWSHGKLDTMPPEEARADIVRGFVSVKAALGKEGERALKPLFRFPFHSITPDLLAWLEKQGVAVISADTTSEDWRGHAPDVTRERTMTRLKRRGGGIVLFHDNQPNTALMIPALLADLEREGFRVRSMTTNTRMPALRP